MVLMTGSGESLEGEGWLMRAEREALVRSATVDVPFKASLSAVRLEESDTASTRTGGGRAGSPSRVCVSRSDPILKIWTGDAAA